jgi:hypothetical protein
LRISRVWNVIEGKKDGFTVLILDVMLGEGRGAQPCTLVFYQTEWNPFEPSLPERKMKRVAGLQEAGGVAEVAAETGVVTKVSGAGVVVPESSKRDLP